MERVVDIGDGKIALICRVELPENHAGNREGYVYYYDKSLCQFYDLNFYADDADEIMVTSSLNSNFIIIVYYQYPEYRELIYQLKPFKLNSERFKEYGEILCVDNKYVYYRNYEKKLVIIRSIHNDKEVKKVNLIGSCDVINNGKALVLLSNGNYQIIDLWFGESKNFNFKDRGYVDISEDGEWLMYCGVDEYSFTGKVIAINLSNGQKREVKIDPAILRKSEDMTIMRFGQAFFITVQPLKIGVKSHNFAKS